MGTQCQSLKEIMKNMIDAPPKKNTPKEPCTIFRVPTFVTDKHEDLYQPQMVTIGPYHHDKAKFWAMEEHKQQYLRDFLGRNKQVSVDGYIDNMLNIKDDARCCYSEMGDMEDETFVPMLLIDGCFILELLLKLDKDKSHRNFSAGTWDFVTILSDLLLIENQIPFFVLEKLYALNSNKRVEESDLKSLLVNNLFIAYLGDSVQPNRAKGPWNQQIKHLLHLYHEVTLPFSNTPQAVGQRKRDHRLPLVIPSATQLLEFGFVLGKQDSHNYKSDPSLKHSTIKIPRLIIDSARKALLMNLLVFEQGLEESKTRWTGLMVMMNCMVKNKSDLEIVQRSGILLNLLPTDDEAIQFFAQQSKRMTVDFNDHYFSDLFKQINIECDAYFRRKRARLMHDYFNNRWAVISFATSICAILLSTIQTLVSVFTYRRRFL